MSAAEGINFVRYYFYRGNTYSDAVKSALVALAYATARDQQLAPKAILIRSALHNTTSFGGKHVQDPKGWHTTIAFKIGDQVAREYHVASHGYTNGKDDYALTEATHPAEKSDDTPRGGNESGKIVWPDQAALEEYMDSPIGYSHLPE